MPHECFAKFSSTTGDKKGHVSTPHPTKQASKTPADKSGKTPATDKKSKEKSPKSGSHACKTCSKYVWLTVFFSLNE
jgi:hypothetical protein